MGMNVGAHADTVAVSTDCQKNILLYHVQKMDDHGRSEDYAVRKGQELEYTVGSGAVTSIAMDERRVVYTTVRDDVGSLFVYDREAGSGYALTQKLDLGGASEDLFVYDAAVEGDLIAVAVANDVALFTLDEEGAWGREPAGLATEGLFAGSRGSSVSMDGGHLFVTSDAEVTVRDMLGCQSYLEGLLGGEEAVGEETGEAPDAPAATAAPSLRPTPVPATSSPVTDGAGVDPATSAPVASVAQEDAQEGYCIEVAVAFDNYPDDTSWTVSRVADGASVASSGAHDGVSSSDRACGLGPGEYEFVISDVYGDGVYVSLLRRFSWRIFRPSRHFSRSRLSLFSRQVLRMGRGELPRVRRRRRPRRRHSRRREVRPRGANALRPAVRAGVVRGRNVGRGRLGGGAGGRGRAA